MKFELIYLYEYKFGILIIVDDYSSIYLDWMDSLCAESVVGSLKENYI